ncbi:MAG: orotate phosphoribosyltransferase [Deltaproteobacteria bacterium]|nr:orotate phosphoribosyltransferase [Deltaproteobacteria bacterium]MBW2385711.1 orotate phosphoribosyltransferase [Deltaproteobacteria bacterium]MBW2695395.1 orotate phosphoribosyltransferase [Deltaproteobacteria bacterium]
MTAEKDPRRRQLRDIILDVSVERREVTLASGQKSDLYLDLRQTLMRPRGMKLAGQLALECLQKGTPVEAVGGMAVGAVPFVAAVLAAAADDERSRDLLGFFVRKQQKQHGLGRQIEGGFREGQTVALVEDTTTTGGSTLEALDIVEAAGGKVARVLCIVDRGEGAVEAFAQRGVALEPLFTRAELGV